MNKKDYPDYHRAYDNKGVYRSGFVRRVFVHGLDPRVANSRGEEYCCVCGGYHAWTDHEEVFSASIILGRNSSLFAIATKRRVYRAENIFQ